MKERPTSWARWWLWMWAAASIALVGTAFLLRPLVWSALATALFGIPEAFALLRRGDRYPPLTYVAAYYVPRWLVQTLVGLLVGWVGAGWFGLAHPWRIGGLLGLLTWALNHFDVTYDTRATWASSTAG